MDIDDEFKQLGQQRERRACRGVQNRLDSFLTRIEERKDLIDATIDGAKSHKAAETPLRGLLSRWVVEAAEGNIISREYSQKAMSKQEVSVYVGTHWLKVRAQVYFDFVKDCCRKAGLPEEYLENPAFMTKLFEQVGFRVARDIEPFVPSGEVWINMQNGTLEVDRGGRVRLREHRREDYFSYVLPYAYEAEAKCPLWRRFLQQVLPEEAAQKVLGEFMGYCFTTDLKLEKMLILYGGGSNGKSVATDIMREMLGRHNVSAVDLEKLTNDDNHRSLIEGKLANIAQENGPNVSYSVLKTIVSGEPVMVKTLYKDPKLIYRYGKLVSSYNKLPKTENTEGFYRRWIILPFNVTIREADRDVHLKDKLCQELPGILNWVLEALQRLVTNRCFTESDESRKALDAYKLSCNSALRFFVERLEVDEGGRLSQKEIYANYLRFCSEDGVQNKYGRVNLCEALERWGAEYVMHHNKKHYKVRCLNY